MQSAFHISNRRYLGNKFKLTPFILDIVNKNCKDIKSIADIFAGTGSVANAFIDKTIITNDILQSNYISNFAWFAPQKFDKNKIQNIIIELNAYDKVQSNYMSENFADTYFSMKVCSKIGFMREDIEDKFKNGKINEKERAILITSLLYAMDKIANTCGHYDAFRKKTRQNDDIVLLMPLISEKVDKNNACFNIDANELVKRIYADLIYIDPPYNSRQYSDAYHLLENVATWQKPKVYGVAKKMDRKHIKSKYCNNKAEQVFADLIGNINAKYILFSYNNIAKKANERSNAKISDKSIMDILEHKGEVSVFSQEHRAFSTGKSKIENNVERLFLCKCR